MRKWSFNHLGDVSAKMNEAATTLRLAGKYMTALGNEADRLATQKVSQTEICDFIERLFPLNENLGKIAVANVKKRIERFHSCYEADDVANFRNTKWRLVLAMSDYTSHVPLRNDGHRERHLAKTVLTGAALLDKAVSLVG